MISLLLMNPITLWLLTDNFVVSVAISFLIVIFTVLLFHKTRSVRLRVWWLNIIAIASICYHAELVFVLLFNKYDVPNLYEIKGAYYFNKPNLEQRFENEEFTSYYKTNEQGLRIPLSIDASKRVKTCDWLFVGDSFTQGAQVDYEEMYTSLLSKWFPDKVIVNAGISGAGIPEIYKYLQGEGMKLHPKHVFLQLGVFNDFCNVQEHKVSLTDYAMEKSHLFRYITHALSSRFDLPIGRWCEPFRPDRQGNIDYNILFKETSAYKEQDKENLSRYIDDIYKLCKSNGADLTVILLPSKEQTLPLAIAEVMEAYQISEDELDMTFPNRWLSTLANDKGIAIVDLLLPFQQSRTSPFFRIDEHLTPVGHHIIATEICKALTYEKTNYSLISSGWTNERYPSLLTDKGTILFQRTYGQNKYAICSTDTTFNFHSIRISSYEELAHPTISINGRYLSYTIGCQERGLTKVCVEDLILGTTTVVTPDSLMAAIPAFSPDANFLAMPVWSTSEHLANEPRIGLYDIEQRKMLMYITDGKHECWRPVFTRDGNSIYYIEKDKTFKIKCYSIDRKTSIDVLATDYDIWDISLSPSGKYIAYAGNPDGNWDLFLFDIEKQDIKRLTMTSANEWDPSFGYDDSDLLFALESGFFDGICRMKVVL